MYEVINVFKLSFIKSHLYMHNGAITNLQIHDQQLSERLYSSVQLTVTHTGSQRFTEAHKGSALPVSVPATP